MDNLESSCRRLLVVGLGNPGVRYHETRHNIGFLALDFVASRSGLSFVSSSLLSGEVAEYSETIKTVRFLKPTTFMNLSGKSVLAAVEEQRLPPACLLVVHDDLDLEFGRIKIAVDRGSGGHNGVQSIIDALQSKAFVRLRCGIGRPRDEMPVVDYVLTSFSSREKVQLPFVLEKIEKAIALIVEKGVVQAMNTVNRETVALSDNLDKQE